MIHKRLYISSIVFLILGSFIAVSCVQAQSVSSKMVLKQLANSAKTVLEVTKNVAASRLVVNYSNSAHANIVSIEAIKDSADSETFLLEYDPGKVQLEDIEFSVIIKHDPITNKKYLLTPKGDTRETNSFELAGDLRIAFTDGAKDPKNSKSKFFEKYELFYLANSNYFLLLKVVTARDGSIHSIGGIGFVLSVLEGFWPAFSSANLDALLLYSPTFDNSVKIAHYLQPDGSFMLGKNKKKSGSRLGRTLSVAKTLASANCLLNDKIILDSKDYQFIKKNGANSSKAKAMIAKILAGQKEYKDGLRKRLLLLDLNRVRALYFDVSKGTIVWIQHPKRDDSSNFCSLTEIEPDEL